MKQTIKEILEGGVEEKIEAIEAIWNSIDDDALPVIDEDILIAKERYEEYLQNPDDLLDWEVARQKLKEKYGF